MNNTARVISQATGCSLAEAQKAIGALIALGWTPPDADRLAGDGDELPGPTAALPGLPAVSADEVLVAHTDGACSGNPGPGGWAVVFSQGGEVIAECSGGEAHTTNNQMELTAVREAVRRAPGNVIVEIVTDSKLVVGWLCQGWKRKEPKNAALCAEIDALRAQRASIGSDTAGNVTFTHVLGHNGNALNERADHLATEAIKPFRNGGR